MTFKGASVLCGVNGIKETTKRLDIGGGLVEEVVATPCNDCADLEWTAWAPCANASSERTIEGMLCRRRGNTYMGFEEEEKGRCQADLRKSKVYFSLQSLLVRLPGPSCQQVATGDEGVQRQFVFSPQGSTSPQ